MHNNIFTFIYFQLRFEYLLTGIIIISIPTSIIQIVIISRISFVKNALLATYSFVNFKTLALHYCNTHRGRNNVIA